MRLAVVGTGYVGLVTGTCFAESGNDVTCVDIDEEKIAGLRRGQVPIYEPGLSELVDRNLTMGRLNFTTDMAEAVTGAEVVYLAVGTPSAHDGAADLSAMWKAVESMAPYLAEEAIVVVKSTVPVGTNAQLTARLKELTGRDVDTASNPEFLKEGAALDDFMKPDRVVVGVHRPEVAKVLRELYTPFLRTENPFLSMSPESAELTKYAANAMLATKISFINELANLCQRMNGDINDVRRGMGHDKRIGFAFLFPGVGYGGSCFPKDVRAIQAMARAHDLDPRVMSAVDEVNNHQKRVLLEYIDRHFDGQVEGKTLAIWGLSFKPHTDDIREAPSQVLIEGLLERGAALRVHDPVAMANVRAIWGDRLQYADEPYAALEGADALAIVTEWEEFRHPDFNRMRRMMRSPLIFDGRNLYEPGRMGQYGFTYYSIGRSRVPAP